MAIILRTQTRCGKLAQVFSATSNKDLHAVIASLCVLFEDLRIELNGMSADDLGKVDDSGKVGRRLYFIRRSIATLYEFSALLQDLDRMPAYQTIRSSFDPIVAREWTRSLAYFGKYDGYVKRLRHNVGGHFGKKAGEEVIKNLLPDAIGCLEIRHFATGGGAKLEFAAEISATGTLRHVPGTTIQSKSRRLMRHAIVGYKMAVRAVDCISAMYLWDRFGR